MVYVHTSMGQAIPGMCSREVFTSVFEPINRIWLKPYGLSIKFQCDPDPLFQGECQSQLEALGAIFDCHLEDNPGETHRHLRDPED